MLGTGLLPIGILVLKPRRIKFLIIIIKMASKQGYGADLRQYMDQLVEVNINANRQVVGILKGYDPFMNVVLDEAFTMVDD